MFFFFVLLVVLLFSFLFNQFFAYPFKKIWLLSLQYKCNYFVFNLQYKIHSIVGKNETFKSFLSNSTEFNDSNRIEDCFEIINYSTRPNEGYYILYKFFFPLLPLDIMGNECKTWEKIYKTFMSFLSKHRFVQNSSKIIERLLDEFWKKNGKSKQMDELEVREIIGKMMWELIFKDVDYGKEFAEMIEITNEISRCITFNYPPEFNKRAKLLKGIVALAKKTHLDILNENNLTNQEIATLYGMEFFVTPMLEMSETLCNTAKFLKETQKNPEDIINNELLFKEFIIDIGGRFPVLQTFFRKKEENLIVLRLDKMAASIARQVPCPFNSPDTGLSTSHCAFAFGAGPRICKGKQLALNVITAFIGYYFKHNNCIPDFRIRSGRLVSPCILDPKERSKAMLFISGHANKLIARDAKYGDMVKRGDRFLVDDSCFV